MNSQMSPNIRLSLTQAQRQLVRNQLCAAAEGSKEAVFVITGPTTKNHAIDSDAGKRKNKQDCGIEAGRDHQIDRRVAAETHLVEKAQSAADLLEQALVRGAEDLGEPFNEHIQLVVDAMATIADQLGFAPSGHSEGPASDK